MRNFARHVGKLALITVVLLLGQTLGGVLFFAGTPAFAPDGPVDTAQALLITNLVDALILVLLANAMRLRGWRLGMLLATALFGVQTAQSAVETIIFGRDVHMPAGLLVATLAAALLRDTLAGAAAALLWRGTDREHAEMSGLAWKAPAIAVFYVVCYFTAGQFIAWQSPAVRDFYAHVGEIDVATLVVLQFGRGLLWCAIAWLLVRYLSGPRWWAALLVGLAFSGFMIPGLLFPNPIMPWPVRSVHMVEIGISNLLFGIGAAWILLAGGVKKMFAQRRGAAESESAA